MAKVEFREANLTNTNLSCAGLRNTVFIDAWLKNTEFTAANIEGAIFGWKEKTMKTTNQYAEYFNESDFRGAGSGKGENNDRTSIPGDLSTDFTKAKFCDNKAGEEKLIGGDDQLLKEVMNACNSKPLSEKEKIKLKKRL